MIIFIPINSNMKYVLAFTQFFFLISQPKHFVVGTQKNWLNELVLLGTQSIMS